LRLQNRPNTSVRFIQGQYSYQDLEKFIDSLAGYLGRSGVSYIGIDEWKNRIEIGVVTADARARMVAAAASSGIPRDAILLQDAKYFVATGTHQLTDNVRPLVGGLQIRVGGTGKGGTLGAIVKLNGNYYGLIASHVADSTGTGLTGQAVYQNATGSVIGHVYSNPAFVQGPGCPQGQPCRAADAALVSLETSFAFTKLAQPLNGAVYNGGQGTLTFDDSDPITITADIADCSNYYNYCNQIQYFPGDILTKIGMTTGWTGGAYRGSTSYLLVDGFWRADVMEIEGADTFGDSGAPIVGNSTGKLAGLAWGAGSVNGVTIILGSKWSNISTELGGDDYRLHSSEAPLLGYEQHLRHDPGCPSNDDALNYYLIYGYPGVGGTYETTQSTYMGHTTYYCDGQYINADYINSAGWQACAAHYGWSYDCPCADMVVGSQTCGMRQDP